MTTLLQRRVVLSACWITVLILFLEGDVLRLHAGDHRVGELAGASAEPWMWTVAAIIMLIPISLIVGSLTFPLRILRPATVAIAIGLTVLNLTGLPYPGMYDTLLILVSAVVCGAIAWQAWSIRSST